MMNVSRWVIVVLFVGLVWVDPAVAQEAANEDVVTVGNREAVKARPMNIFRVRSKSFESSNTEVEGSEGEDDAKVDEVGAEPEAEEEEEVVDSFIVLAGNHRFHIDSCKLVTTSKVAKQTLNG